MSSNSLSTRERILNASWKLLEQGAGKTVRMADIAKQAKVSRQAVYMLFENRANLVRATRIHVDELHGVSEKIRKILSQNSPELMLLEYIAFWAAYLPNIYGLARAMQLGALHDVAAAQAWQDCLDEHFDVCLRIATALEHDGILQAGWTCQSASEIIFTSVSLDGWAELVVKRNWARSRYVDHTFALVLGGLSTKVKSQSM